MKSLQVNLNEATQAVEPIDNAVQEFLILGGLANTHVHHDLLDLRELMPHGRHQRVPEALRVFADLFGPGEGSIPPPPGT